MNKTPKTPKTRPLFNMPTHINVLRTAMYIIGLLAMALIVVSSVNGCAAPAKPAPPIATDPSVPIPPPDVGQCQAEIRSMESAVAMASVAAKLLVSKNSEYGPAVDLALVAIRGALANAKAQCATGSVDAWAIALAAFDAAFADLVLAGEEPGAASVPNDIQPPPPTYAFSCIEFQSMALHEEMER